jgi:signal transduction histidine kinase
MPRRVKTNGTSNGTASTVDQNEARHRSSLVTTAAAELIDDLLDMSRILTGKLRIDIRPLDLVAVVAAAVDISAPSALAKGVDLRVRMMPRLPFVGDAERLRQIVWNIVSNAVKFTPQGGTIDVEVIVDDGAAVIRVRDTGDGIEAAFLPYVFQRFRQADSSTSRQHGGLGIGLSLVRELVELHGGSVRAESDGLGRGATLSVRLPLAAGLLEGGTGVGSGETRDGRAPLAGIAVLVVDDEVDTREMLRTMLTGEGAEVAAAGGTDDAFAALLDHPRA